MVTMSMAPAVVLSVGVPPANLTAVLVSVPNEAVLDPVPSCTMIMLTDPPVGRFAMTKPVLVASVTLCTDARAQLTVMVELEVKELMFSINPALNVTALVKVLAPVMVCVVDTNTVSAVAAPAVPRSRCTLYPLTVVLAPDVLAAFRATVLPVRVAVNSN